jgi:hypothetical protein
MTSTLNSFVGPNGTEGFVGLAAVNRAREAGYSDQKIQEMAKEENLQFGADAEKSLAAS